MFHLYCFLPLLLKQNGYDWLSAISFLLLPHRFILSSPSFKHAQATHNRPLTILCDSWAVLLCLCASFFFPFSSLALCWGLLPQIHLGNYWIWSPFYVTFQHISLWFSFKTIGMTAPISSQNYYLKGTGTFSSHPVAFPKVCLLEV